MAGTSIGQPGDVAVKMQLNNDPTYDPRLMMKPREPNVRLACTGQD